MYSAKPILKVEHSMIKVQPLEIDILCIDFLKAIKFIIEITSSFIANSAHMYARLYSHSVTRFVRINLFLATPLIELEWKEHKNKIKQNKTKRK